MSTNIDRSLDEIIKEQRKLKKKANQSSKPQKGQKKAKQQKQPQKGKLQGKGTIQQGRRKPVGKQGGQGSQQRRRAGQNYGKNKTAANRGKPGRARVLANRLKSKQGSVQKSKQVVSKAKQIQMSRRTKNRQTWQTQQNDARQNIVNKKRGLQGTRQQKRYQNPKKTNKQQWITNNQRRNRNVNTAPQVANSVSSPRVRLSRSPRWKQNSNRREGQNRGRQWQDQIIGHTIPSEMATQDLRISIPNNLHQPPIPPVNPGTFNYDQRVSCALGTTSTTLNERFSDAPRRGVRTIVVD